MEVFLAYLLDNLLDFSILTLVLSYLMAFNAFSNFFFFKIFSDTESPINF
jgi:hypothetical protein